MIPRPRRVLLARDPVDFRKQIEGLASLCERELGEEPLDGTAFVFRNRTTRSIKLLMWTRGGFSLVYKKLEEGRFPWPRMEGDRVVLSDAELAALLEGIDLSGASRIPSWNPKNQHDNSPSSS